MLFIRIAAYVLSGVALCQVFTGGGGLASIFVSGKMIALDPDNAMILGVCSGICNYTGIDVTFIRFFWAIASLYRGIGAGLYLLAFLLMPLPG